MQGFNPSLEDTFLEKPEGGQIDPLCLFRVKIIQIFKERFCVTFSYQPVHVCLLTTDPLVHRDLLHAEIFSQYQVNT